jgi:hypothetical protein
MLNTTHTHRRATPPTTRRSRRAHHTTMVRTQATIDSTAQVTVLQVTTTRTARTTVLLESTDHRRQRPTAPSILRRSSRSSYT